MYKYLQCGIILSILCGLLYEPSFSQVRKIIYSGSQVEIEVSGSIYGDDVSPDQDDPLAGLVIWYYTSGQDGSATKAVILEGTHYYKSNPDIFSFTSHFNADWLYAFSIHEEPYPSTAGSYQLKVNGITYEINESNVIYFDEFFSKVKKINFTGQQVEIEVSGSIYGDDISPDQDDPLAGLVIWYYTSGQDGSATKAVILEGTHYYKSDPDIFSFTSHFNADYLYAFSIHEEPDPSIAGSYQLKVNGITYEINESNVIYFDGITSIYDRDSSPLNYSISQNYPNPFNPSTKILYSIPTSSYVVLKIYDVLGNEIMTLVDGEKAIGNYDISLDASRFSSGVYFYKLQASPSSSVGESFVEIRKMVLLK